MEAYVVRIGFIEQTERLRRGSLGVSQVCYLPYGLPTSARRGPKVIHLAVVTTVLVSNDLVASVGKPCSLFDVFRVEGAPGSGLTGAGHAWCPPSMPFEVAGRSLQMTWPAISVTFALVTRDRVASVVQACFSLWCFQRWRIHLNRGRQVSIRQGVHLGWPNVNCR